VSPLTNGAIIELPNKMTVGPRGLTYGPTGRAYVAGGLLPSIPTVDGNGLPGRYA